MSFLIYNILYQPNRTPGKLLMERGFLLAAATHLAGIIFVSALLIIYLLYMKFIVLSVTALPEASTAVITGTESFQLINYSNSTILLMLSHFYKKIPSWVKLLFKLIFIAVIIIKLLGFNIFQILDNSYYLKIYMLCTCSLAILYQLLNIYLYYIYITKKPKIPEYLPEFIINWLEEFEKMAKFKLNFKFFKKTCYIEITIYITILLLTLLVV